jgi:hypothetical protein
VPVDRRSARLLRVARIRGHVSAEGAERLRIGLATRLLGEVDEVALETDERASIADELARADELRLAIG